MPATEVDQYFFEAKPLWVGKVGAAGVASAVATTIPAQSAVGLTDGNAYIVTVNRTDPSGTTKNAANERETFIGKLSGSNFINCIRAVEGAAQAWEADTVMEILVTATAWSKLIEGIENIETNFLEEHSAAGKHKIAALDAIRYAEDAGGDDTYEVTLDPAPVEYYEGMLVIFSPTTANTGATTLNVNGLGAKAIKKRHDVDLADGDIEVGQIVAVVYDGTTFQMVSQLGQAPVAGDSRITEVLNWANAVLPDSNFPSLGKTVGTNWVYRTLDFDKTNDEAAYWMVQIPTDLTPTSAKVILYLTAAGGTAAQVSYWQVTSRTPDHDEVVDATTTPASATDSGNVALTATGDLLILEIPLTITGWAAGDMLMLKINRDADNASDNLDADAKLIEAVLEVR